ncbi:MAG: biotin--[acetyl-CoA-carboxylase] ligase [Bacteroidetes bacterium]|nr:biotin--[acetyl-CoA-carboxylase] ligase [Bacteroidota bacterium]
MNTKISTISNLIYLNECESTNTFLYQKLNEDKELQEFITIITDRQNLGRGQKNNKWESKPFKNITFSMLLKPYFIEPKFAFYLNMIISNIIYDCLSKYLIPLNLKIKWPNDIYYNDKKMGGILIENIISDNKIKYSIIGIGINVNQIKFLNKKATSIAIELMEEINLQNIRTELINLLILDFENLKRNFDDNIIKGKYLNNLYRKSENHYFIEKDIKFEGKILGINEYGKLVILNSNGITKTYFSKEIQFI